MRGKKLTRQLSKSLDYEDIESELPQLTEWITPLKESNEHAAKLATAFENLGAFFDAIESSYEQYESNLKHATTSLEISGKEVEERNRALRVEVRKVSNLLNNMKQAVFTVAADGGIVGPVSKFSGEVFDGDIEGRNIFDVLYKSIPQDSEEYSGLKSAFIAVYGEGELQWDLMVDHFPKRLILPRGNEEQILKITTSPLWDDNENIEQLMLIVEDITELEALNRKIELEKARSGRSMAIVQELINCSREEIEAFFERSREQMHEIGVLLATSKFGGEGINLIFRNLHTIKGNARSYGLQQLSGATHKVESEFVRIRENRDSLDLSVELPIFQKTFMPLMVDQMNEYQEMMKKLYSGAAASSSAALNPERIDGFRAFLQSLNGKLSSDVLDQIDNQFLEAAGKTASSQWKSAMTTTVQRTAEETSKDVSLNWSSEIVLLDDSTARKIEEMMIHIVSNAVDHGIEQPEERVRKGKPAQARVEIHVQLTPSALEISVKDDGRGIDPLRIAEVAVAKGLLSEQEAVKMKPQDAIALILKPGFSTKQIVSEVSGRGVGLDVVQSRLEEIGGKLQIDSKLEKGSEFKMIFPLQSNSPSQAA